MRSAFRWAEKLFIPLINGVESLNFNEEIQQIMAIKVGIYDDESGMPNEIGKPSNQIAIFMFLMSLDGKIFFVSGIFAMISFHERQ